MPDSRSDRIVAAALVGGQLGLLSLLAALPRGEDWPTPAWLRRTAVVGQLAGVSVAAVAAAGLGPGLTPSPLPRAQAELRTTGLYRLVRHPVYAGLLLAATSRAAGSGNRQTAGAAAALVALLSVKARFEEGFLARLFAGYPAYAERTPRFVPRR